MKNIEIIGIAMGLIILLLLVMRVVKGLEK